MTDNVSEETSSLAALDAIAFDWALRCFGDQMANPQERTLRMIEEAIEVGQAAGLPEVLLHEQVFEVYKRPRGTLTKELGGLCHTLRLLCTTLGVNPEALRVAELRRVLSFSPEHFAKRNREKLDLGLKAGPKTGDV